MTLIWLSRCSDSDTDSESSATEPIADNNVNSIDENDLVTNSNIDEDSLAENEKDSSHQMNDQESAVEDESISSVSDIMSDAVCAFFKETVRGECQPPPPDRSTLVFCGSSNCRRHFCAFS